MPTTTTSPALDPGRWVDEHGDALLRFALQRVGNRATAEDLVQETLLAAWQARDRFEGGSAFRTWLVGILKRRIADHYRQRSRERSPSDKPSDEFLPSGDWAENPQAWRPGPMRAVERPADGAAEDAEFWGVVTRCTGDLPEHLGRAFRLRTLVGGGVESVCEEEGITAKNLSVRLHRARLLMRRCLERRWFGDTPSRPAEGSAPAGDSQQGEG